MHFLFNFSFAVIIFGCGFVLGDVTFYEHTEFAGSRLTLQTSPSCRNFPSNWNDRASSADTAGSCVTLYEDINCQGASISLAPGTPSHNNFVELDFNDRASSLKACGDDGKSSPGLDGHNKYRSRHGVPPLVHDEKVSASAQQCADYLAANKIFDHVCGQVFGHKYGENLAAGSGFRDKDSATVQSTDMWYGEEPKHDYNDNNFQYESGHFSQVVWKNSKRLGLGYAENGDFKVVVGHYDPPGNYQGQFLENVLRPKNK